MSRFEPPRLEDITGADPKRIETYLMRHGWERFGGRPGLYDRYRWTGNQSEAGRHSLILPLDQSRADYPELMSDLLLRVLSVDPGAAASLEMELLGGSPGDEFKFRKEAATVGGAVAWTTGRELIWAAENILLAGAKTRLSRRAYYGQANGRFAHRFLNSVLMGQTEIGSYVVTAFAPVNEAFPDKTPKAGEPSISGLGTYTGREIVESVVAGLESTIDALDHYRATNSLTGFEEGVNSGVSREMVEAVRRMVLNSDGADVTVEWSAEVESLQPQHATTRLQFDGSAAPILERAGHKLASLQPAQHIVASGRLSLVSRPKRGQLGIVRLKVSTGSDASTLQIRLDEEAFEVAAAAIAHEQVVEVRGRQEREGNRFWLYDADLRPVRSTDNGEQSLF